MAQNVTTFTESDFSRTFQPTTSDGSDHAWGSHHLVLGGAVQGGQIYGKFPTFELGGPERRRYARPLDSDHVHRSIRRDAVFLVRDSRHVRSPPFSRTSRISDRRSWGFSDRAGAHSLTVVVLNRARERTGDYFAVTGTSATVFSHASCSLALFAPRLESVIL